MPSLLEDLRWRGLVHQMTDQAQLPALLDEGRLCFYVGFDPSAPSLHVGHLQQICLMARLVRAGHRAVALVGGGTGMIGDPSGRSEERNLLEPEVLETNRKAVAEQVERLVRRAAGQVPTERIVLADNAEWLEQVGLIEFLRQVGKHFSVNEMIRKDSVRTRLEGRNQSLSFTEFAYMLLQAWDFVQLYDRWECRLQLGGSDQWGNITEGVELIRRLRGAVAFGLTSPLVTKADGTKFGKTESGALWLDGSLSSAYEFYQFWLRTQDADVGAYLRRFSMREREEIEHLERQVVLEPQQREAQRALAAEMTTLVHGQEEAERAQAAAEALFSEEVSRLDAQTLETALSGAPGLELDAAELARGLEVVDALCRVGLAGSRREARQLLAQGSIYLNGSRLGTEATIDTADALHGRWVLLRRGRATQRVLVVRPTA